MVAILEGSTVQRAAGSTSMTLAGSPASSGRPWSWTRVLGRRLFPARERVDNELMRLYRRAWPTLELPANTRHRLKYAF